MVVVLLVGLAGPYGPGCSREAEDPDRTGESDASKGSCPSADDDRNPCTLEACKGSVQEHVPDTDHACGRNEKLRCDANGKCVGCLMDNDCGDPGECTKWTCESHVCELTPLDKDTILQQQTGDCKKWQCDGKGDKHQVPQDDDVPDASVCQTVWCIGGAPAFANMAPGTPCGSGDHCFDAQCVSCFDGTLNGDELDEDCGGAYCGKCKQAQKCNLDSDCATGACADGVCCENACDGVCRACNQPGKSKGKCEDLPGGEVDTNASTPCSALSPVCTAGGTCIDRKANGEPCKEALDCGSQACVGGYCKQNNGPCASGGDCASGSCTGNPPVCVALQP